MSEPEAPRSAPEAAGSGQASAAPLLEVRGLTAHHGQLRALADVSLRVLRGDVYAIIPGWPGRAFVLKDVAPTPKATVTLLGRSGTLRWEKTTGGMKIQLPELSADRAKAQYAYVLKVSGI